MIRPLISDLESTHQYKDGDCILAKVSVNLGAEKQKKLARSIRKWARAEVSVLVLNCMNTVLQLERPDEPNRVLCGPGDFTYQDQNQQVLNLACTAIDFREGDTLWVTAPLLESRQKKAVRNGLRRWVGIDIDVQFTGVGG